MLSRRGMHHCYQIWEDTECWLQYPFVLNMETNELPKKETQDEEMTSQHNPQVNLLLLDITFLESLTGKGN